MKEERMMRRSDGGINRRDFLMAAAGLAAWPGGKAWAGLGNPPKPSKTKIALVKTGDRRQGVRQAMNLLDLTPAKGKRILLKPNFNTADPTPGSTHRETLAEIVAGLKERGAAAITVGERSGPPPTKKVMEDLGVFDLSRELSFAVLNFEELADAEWIHLNPAGSHWPEGFYVPRAVAESEYVVSTCCLKTHQYGGVFSMSLKLAVGLTPKKLMRQLHSSPDMRKMIAEINLGYTPRLIVMDGLEAFVDGGPMTGRRAEAGVVIAGTDRVAVDAVGLAVLKALGSNAAIMERKIFEQEQIRRAVELGLGIGDPSQIEFLASDEAGREYAEKLRQVLARG